MAESRSVNEFRVFARAKFKFYDFAMPCCVGSAVGFLADFFCAQVEVRVDCVCQ